MWLTCPACGAMASAETWQNDTAARETLAAILQLPSAVAPLILGYLGLFRPPRSGLPWSQAKNLVTSLTPLLASGQVTWRAAPPRPCPPESWAAAMIAVAERTRRRPLRSHQYLTFVAYQLAAVPPAAPARVDAADRRLIRETLNRLRHELPEVLAAETGDDC